MSSVFKLVEGEFIQIDEEGNVIPVQLLNNEIVNLLEKILEEQKKINFSLEQLTS